MPAPDNTLPINAVLHQIIAALGQADQLVLQAPPGAGKTTGVPLALLAAGFCAQGKIIMLEPRRIAARNAAHRMAAIVGEPVGQTVGYRVRMDQKVSAATRIEVVTQGVFIRMLAQDPGLEQVALVIFDEFHERALEADLALAMTLQARLLLREQQPLKLMVMSATLQQLGVAALLQSALQQPVPVISSEGRSFPVVVQHTGPRPDSRRLPQVLATTVADALARHSGSVLVFLPGVADIRRLAKMLAAPGVLPAGVQVLPLYGDLPLAQQQQAIAPMAHEQGRKVVLATAIAESSITIDGVTVVVDAGLSRQPKFDPNTGLTRLQTERASQAATTQRAGRSGRTAPGHCYRLWSEAEQWQLPEHSPAEILQADLAPLALQLLDWGVADPAELYWLDVPPQGSYQQALQLLQMLGAISCEGNGSWQANAHGRAILQLGLAPRLGHMLLHARQWHSEGLACDLAAYLYEGTGIRSGSAEITSGGLLPGREQQRVAQRLQRLLSAIPGAAQSDSMTAQPCSVGQLLALAYPDRVARQRQSGGVRYQLANGREAVLHDDDPLRNQAWLVVAACGGGVNSNSDRIFAAAPFDPAWLEHALADLVQCQQVVEWPLREPALVAEQQWRLGQLVLRRAPLVKPDQGPIVAAVLAYIRARGLAVLPWTNGLHQWCRRLAIMQQHCTAAGQDNPWPIVSEEHLLATLEQWLAPYVTAVRRVEHLQALDLTAILRNQLSWQLQQQLDSELPTHITVPSGSRLAIDYSQSPPVLAVRLQEMFGCATTPTVLSGSLMLQLHLLSPAGRPLQVTQDLAGFWQSSYQMVKKEMKGRYPKHPWPDDPLQAAPTRRAKPRPAR